ncbi:MAG TPA: branched-chain amino acid ABC transporter permease [Rhodocyclaceae bacterium]|nr:branched-chain amino acid ABC transporter permease [Rhodocyclaceae bacterium]
MSAVRDLLGSLTPLGRTLLALIALGLLVLPYVLNSYLLTLAILILYLAYTGQAWNVMMGFCGQLSLGHALYVGLGAYAAAMLYAKLGVGPWAGIWLALLLCVLAGAVIGFLAFRFSIAGVYFALLTIAFAEFTRIGFENLPWVGATGGLFIKVTQRQHIDLINLRGTPAMFYYVILALAAAAFALSSWLLRSRAGYYWQAIREDEEAAKALGINTFLWKMVAVVVSAAMTGVAGVFYAFYYNNLFPGQIFNIEQSIEIILGPIIGGVGTLFGPILGATLITVLGEGITNLVNVLGFSIPGIKQVFYGVALMAVIMFLPDGIWPPLARLLKLRRRS